MDLLGNIILLSTEMAYRLKNKGKHLMNLLMEAKCKTKHGEGFKILTPERMLQRLPIGLAQVKASNTSENLINEISKDHID